MPSPYDLSVLGGQGSFDPGVSGLPSMPPPPQPESRFQQILGGLLGPGKQYGGLLDPAMQQQIKNQTLLNIGASLLASSRNGQGLGANAGQAILGAQQAKQQSIDDQIRNMVLISKSQDQHRSDLVPIIGADGKPRYVKASDAVGQQAVSTIKAGGGIGTYNPGEYTPESFAEFIKTNDPSVLKRYVTPSNPTVQTIGGVPTGVQLDRNGVNAPIQTPLSTLPTELDAKTKIANAQSSGATTGTKTAEAKFDLPRIQQTLTESLSVIDKLRNSPGLKYITGPYSAAPVIPGTAQAEASALAEQVKGGAFLQAYQTLKGAGAITDTEGEKATAAVARLQRAQSTKAYQLALDDLTTVIQSGIKRAQTNAGSTPNNDPLGLR